MLKAAKLLVVMLCMATQVGYAATGALRGRTLDAATREPLAAVQISFVNNPGSAMSDGDGQFSIDHVEPGTYHVQGYAFGYEVVVKAEVEILPHRTTEVELAFGEKVYEGEEVTISTGFFAEVQHDMPTSARSLSYEEVRRAPGGAADVQRIIQALPGVLSENDQNNEIVVRGGSPNENLTIIDGLEIDNINHYGYQEGGGGPISLLNPEFLRDVTFASGGFSAKYGDRASSVLNLELRDGSRETREAELEMSMAGAGGLVESPIARGKGAVILSARKSYLDLFPQGAIGLTAVPNYWDVQGKLTYDLSANHKLTVNGLLGKDEIYFNDDEPSAFSRGAESVEYYGDRFIAGARLRSLWGRSFTDLVVGATRATYNAEVANAEYDAQGRRALTKEFSNNSAEMTQQASLSWNGGARDRDEWSLGGSIKPVTFEHDIYFANDTVIFEDGYLGSQNALPDTFVQAAYRIQERATSPKYGAYAQYAWRPAKAWSFTPGLRYDGFEYSGDHKLGPRFAASYDARRNVTIAAAYGWYYQSHPFTTYTEEPNGGNRKLEHYRAIQYVLGMRWIPRASSLISIESYYKEYDDLLVSAEDIVRETTGDYGYRSQRRLPERTKTAFGAELFLQQKLAQHWYGTASYSYGRTETDDPAYGVRPGQHDYRHVVTLVGGYKTNFSRNEGYRNFQKQWYGWLTHALPINGDELTFASRLRYMSGRPFTRNVWYAEGGGAPDPVYEAHWYKDGYNTDRYPDYVRWDVRLDNKHYIGATSLVFFLELQNVLNRANIAEYIFDDSGERIEAYQFRAFFIGGVKLEL